RLARHLEDFCTAHAVDASAVVTDDADAVLMDEMIEKHLRELGEEEATLLPADRQLLIRLHDRLQTRKERRRNRELYSSDSDESLSDRVLKLLDEELDFGIAKLA